MFSQQEPKHRKERYHDSSLKEPKGYSECVKGGTTDNAMPKTTKGETTIYKHYTEN